MTSSPVATCECDGLAGATALVPEDAQVVKRVWITRRDREDATVDRLCVIEVAAAVQAHRQRQGLVTIEQVSR
jgi:hypothetical protein